MDSVATPSRSDAHWLLPINPGAHQEHQPADWRTRAQTTAVWAAIGRSQPIERWCLRSGYRTMQAGDVIWAYLAVRQEVCAVGRVRAVIEDHGAWLVDIVWDEARTRVLCHHPVPRARFSQVPMSTCRARPATVEVLCDALHVTGERSDVTTSETTRGMRGGS